MTEYILQLSPERVLSDDDQDVEDFGDKLAGEVTSNEFAEESDLSNRDPNVLETIREVLNQQLDDDDLDNLSDIDVVPSKQNFDQIETPSLFESLEQPKRKQKITDNQQQKQKPIKELLKWNTIKTKENVKPNESRIQSIRVRQNNQNNKQTLKANKYQHVESKVKSSLDQRNRSASSKTNLLNISDIEKTKCKGVIEESSFLHDFVELDLTKMIDQIHHKKDFLFQKIKQIHRVPSKQMNVNNSLNQGQKGGVIVKNTKKQQPSVEVPLVDLYQQLLKSRLKPQKKEQKMQRSSSLVIKSPQQSPAQSPIKRQPGKIMRQNSGKKAIENNNRLQSLEVKCINMINQVEEIYREIIQIKQNQEYVSL